MTFQYFVSFYKGINVWPVVYGGRYKLSLLALLTNTTQEMKYTATFENEESF